VVDADLMVAAIQNVPKQLTIESHMTHKRRQLVIVQEVGQIVDGVERSHLVSSFLSSYIDIIPSILEKSIGKIYFFWIFFALQISCQKTFFLFGTPFASRAD